MVKKINNIKTSDSSNLIKEADYDTKIGEIEKKTFDDNYDRYPSKHSSRWKCTEDALKTS